MVRGRVGFKFRPTDEELVRYYLLNKLSGSPLPSDEFVKECNLYGDREPWEIWEHFRGPILADNQEDQEDLYLFTPLKSKTLNGSRIDRTVGSNGSSWHGEDSGKISKTGDGISWIQKRFRYEKSGKFQKKQNEKDDEDEGWIMHEYSLAQPCLNISQNNFVLCRIIKKENGNSKKRKSSSEKFTVIEIDDSDVDDDTTGDFEESNKRPKIEETAAATGPPLASVTPEEATTMLQTENTAAGGGNFSVVSMGDGFGSSNSDELIGEWYEGAADDALQLAFSVEELLGDDDASFLAPVHVY